MKKRIRGDYLYARGYIPNALWGFRHIGLTVAFVLTSLSLNYIIIVQIIILLMILYFHYTYLINISLQKSDRA